MSFADSRYTVAQSITLIGVHLTEGFSRSQHVSSWTKKAPANSLSAALETSGQLAGLRYSIRDKSALTYMLIYLNNLNDLVHTQK